MSPPDPACDPCEPDLSLRPPAAAVPPRLVWHVPDMDCVVEEGTVCAALESLPGVRGLRVDLKRRQVEVDASASAADAIDRALASAGLPGRRIAAGDGHPAQGVHGHGHDHDHAHGHAHGHAGRHDHGHDHDHATSDNPRRLGVALALALAAEGVALLAPETRIWQGAGLLLAVVAIALAGLGVYRKGLVALRHGRLNINALMAVAVTGAILIGEWPEAAMVMVLYAIAEAIEARAVDRARGAIAGLLALAPESARVRQPDGTWLPQSVAQVPVGAVIEVRAGERMPLDGRILEGNTTVDQSAVTGESLPVDKAHGDAVFAGTVNVTGTVQIETSAGVGQSTLARIIEAVEQAQANRAPTQRLVDRFAAVYTPAVFALALAVALLGPLLAGWNWLDAVYKALVMLVIACPCALVIAMPVTVVSALTAAARRGVLIKGGAHLESARLLKAVALDKTGTLTEGRPRLVGWHAAPEVDAGAARREAAALAAASDHPVSRAIAEGLSAADPERLALGDVQALAGRGLKATLRGADGTGSERLWGNRRLMQEAGVDLVAVESLLVAQHAAGHSVTLLADRTRVLGVFAVADTLKPAARGAVEHMRALGLKPTLLSGDHAVTARAVGAAAGIEDARGDLLPEDKLEAIGALQRMQGPTAMVGDGINDAPALARADLGFAMGAIGSDIALEAADVVVMNDDLGRIPQTVELSQATHRTLWQNIALAVGIKVVFLALALVGVATMWMAVFADVGASLLVVANGLRLLRWQPRQGG